MSDDFSICKPNECHILIELERAIRMERIIDMVYIRKIKQGKITPFKDSIAFFQGGIHRATSILTLIRSKKGGA
jgi:hypothetical protein